jgi:hypothetical protein
MKTLAAGRLLRFDTRSTPSSQSPTDEVIRWRIRIRRVGYTEKK